MSHANVHTIVATISLVMCLGKLSTCKTNSISQRKRDARRRLYRRVLRSAGAGCLMLLATPALAQLYSVTDLGVLPGGLQSQGNAINVNGFVAGYSDSSCCPRAVRWDPGTSMLTDLGDLPNETLAYTGLAINSAGQVAGIGGSLAFPRGYIWLPAAAYGLPAGMNALGSLPGGGNFSVATGLNGSGFVAGWSDTNSGNHAFRWDPSTHNMTDLGGLISGGNSLGRGINGSGQVVGGANAGGGDHPFLWLPAPAYGLPAGMNDLGLLPGAPVNIGQALAVDDSGHVTGESSAPGGSYAFLWDPGTHLMQDLGALTGGNFSRGFAINNLQEVVGESTSAVGLHAFLWSSSGGMIDLNNHLNATGAGWVLHVANGINDNGWIVGNGVNALGQSHGYLLRPVVPEPTSLAMLLLGVCGFGSLGRRSRGRVSRMSPALPRAKPNGIKHRVVNSRGRILGLAAVTFVAACLMGLLSEARAVSWRLYTVTDANQLVSINVDNHTTGTPFSATTIGVTQDASGGPTRLIRGLAYDETADIMYGMTRNGELVTVDRSSGETTLQYTLPGVTSNDFWSGLAFDGVNKLYTANPFGTHNLVEITLGGTITSQIVGPTDFNSSVPLQVLGLDFYPASAPVVPPTTNGTHPAPGVLYGSNRNNDNIVVVNQNTGAVTMPFSNHTIGVNNLQEIAFHPGTGYLWSIHDHYSQSNNAALSTYNFTTEMATEEGELPFGIVENVGGGNDTYGWGGLTFAPVPEPSAGLMMVGVLGMGSFLRRRRRQSPAVGT